MLPVASLKEEAEGSGVDGCCCLHADQGPRQLNDSRSERQTDRVLRTHSRQACGQEEKGGREGFYGELRTKSDGLSQVSES